MHQKTKSKTMENRIVYLSFKRNDGGLVYKRGEKYINDIGSLVAYSQGGKYICVTTTMNCLVQNKWTDDLDYEVNEISYHPNPTWAMIEPYDTIEGSKEILERL